MYLRDTIAAISSSPAEGAIGIVRISGDDALAVAEGVFQGVSRPKLKDLESFSLAYGFVVDPLNGERVDEALFSVMRKPRSYTREDVVEINCHGGAQALRKTLEVVLRQGARLAEAGEFTKRAFLNGRIDLAQAEAVIDVIRAPGSTGLKLALSQLEGRFSQKTRMIRKSLLDVRADLEASIDFPEEDLELAGRRRNGALLATGVGAIEELLEQAEEGRVYRLGVETAIVGRPNVGKSSLLNALLREERAIVTETPGTTRDVIEETVSVNGIPLKLRDTAGIRKPEGPAEEIGVSRAYRALEEADLVVCVIDRSQALGPEDKEIFERVRKKRLVAVLNKKDLPGRIGQKEVRERLPGTALVEVSALTGEGIEDLEEAMAETVFDGKTRSSEDLIGCNGRHQQALRAALSHLKEAQEGLANGVGEEIVCVSLADGLRELDNILGESAEEDLLDRIFSKFCIGK